MAKFFGAGDRCVIRNAEGYAGRWGRIVQHDSGGYLVRLTDRRYHGDYEVKWFPPACVCKE